MARRKKVLQEIALDSDEENPSKTTVDTSTTEVPQPVEQQAPPPPPPPPAPVQQPTVIEQPVAPIKKKSRKALAPAAVDQRREALRKANEAKLRKKIERELAEKERRRNEEEHRMELKVKQMVEEQLRRYQSASYVPTQQSMSRRAKVKVPYKKPPPIPSMVDDDDEDEDDYQIVQDSVNEYGEDDEEMEAEQPPASYGRARVPPTAGATQSYQQRLFSQIFGK